jgi:hypothetical protein
MSTGTAGLASKIIQGAGDYHKLAEYEPLDTQLKTALAQGKAVDQAVKSFGGLVDTIDKKNKQENAMLVQQWDSLSSDALDSDEFMSDTEYQDLYSDLESEREEFINADKKQKAVLLNNLEKRNDNINAYKDFKTDLAMSAKSDNGIKNNEMFLTSTLGQSYKGLFDGSTPMIKNEKGEYGGMIYNPNLQEERRRELEEINNTIDLADVANDGNSILDLNKRRQELEEEIYASDLNPSLDVSWTSVGDMRRELENQSFDEATNNLITEAASAQWNTGSKTPFGTGQSFDYDRTLSVVKKQIVGGSNVNKRSLIYDKHLDESFYDTITNEISQLTDQDLGLQNYGISPEIISSLDPGTDGDPTRIMPQDARIIAKSIAESQDVDEYLATYFAKHIEKNYISGYNSRPVPNNVSNLNEYA